MTVTVDAPSFTDRFTAAARAALRPRTWRPAPPVSDRAAWADVTDADREALLTVAHARRDAAAVTFPTLALWATYSRDGDRRPYERAQRNLLESAGTAALALGVTGEDEWADVLADQLWRICEMRAWCLPSHYALPEDGSRPFLPLPGRDVLDLSDAYVGGMLAAIDAIAGERLERDRPGIRAHVHHEIRRRVLDPWEQDVYFWHGVDGPPNNWAPWIVSNVLVCAAVVEPDADRLEATIDRALVILDRFRAGYDADGSCDEGATYWWWAGATLFEALDLVEELTDRTFDGFSVAPVAAMARFPMGMQIGARSQVNHSDGSPALAENANWHLLGRFGERVGDDQVVRHARWMGRQHPLRFDGQLAALFRRTTAELLDASWTSDDAGPAEPGMPASLWLPGTEVAVARDHDGAVDGFVLAVKGGHNDVSHNHNDAGGVIVSLDGEPVLIDVGVGVYRRETFMPEHRYGIWTMRSAWHGVPLPNGVEQHEGASYRATGTAFEDDGARAVWSADLAAAYPPSSGLVTLGRSATLDRAAERVVVRDTWTFAEPGTMTLVLMTRDEPVPVDGGLLVGPAHLAVDTGRFDVLVDRREVDDEKLERVWGPAVHRVRLVARDHATAGEHVLTLTRATAPAGKTA
ncbi:heparinase II/III family protein [Curtobacterium sp. PhB115]|uniref:heparinase II/III family protein n=1 Tax=Curtobacterium sp. PhB115 TaxID=2485173 RepID=UPI000F4BC634|nr:heparinase II/III family protein [Curtobacterium sp. PhB115]ROP60632.1 heparinase II/III-like protein [Curtobacterium sp. PhB115]